MLTPHQETISNIEAILGSIESDALVRRWFVHLIMMPQVKEKILAREPKNTHYYKTLKVIWQMELTLHGGNLCVAAGILAFKAYAWIPGMAALLLGQWIFNKKKITALTHLSRTLIDYDYTPEELSRHSLYQMCERYGQSYDIPTLVDVLPTHTATQRTIIFLIIIFFLTILPLNLFQMISFGILTYFTLVFCLNLFDSKNFLI